MKGDVTDKLIWRILAETQFRMFCLPIKAQILEADVHGSVHRNINLIERCNRVVEFIIPMFLNCSTCFGRHTAHHHELKNCNCSLWFCIRFWLQPKMYVKPEAAITVFELLMMGGMSPEIC
jgi:hypothetical protein